MRDGHKKVKIHLCFYDWIERKTGKSIYGESDLSWGVFHSGTTFDAEIELAEGEDQELLEAIKKDALPVFLLDFPTLQETDHEQTH